MTTLNDAVSFASLKRQVDYFRFAQATSRLLSHLLQQLRWFRAPKFNSHSSEWLCCYMAVIQYWTLSPVDFCNAQILENQKKHIQNISFTTDLDVYRTKSSGLMGMFTDFGNTVAWITHWRNGLSQWFLTAGRHQYGAILHLLPFV